MIGTFTHAFGEARQYAERVEVRARLRAIWPDADQLPAGIRQNLSRHT
jgi:hypothetical protein